MARARRSHLCSVTTMDEEELHSFGDSLRGRIEAEYQRRNDTHGWRLLYAPLRTLKGAPAAVIGQNPAGSFEDAHAHPLLATPPGISAYRDEVWGDTPAGESPLQRQVMALFKRLRTKPEDVLAGNLVPFRSQGWEALPARGDALRFGMDLWRTIFDRAGVPSVVVTLGKVTFSPVAELLNAGAVTEVPYRWGSETASVASYPGGRLIGLPNLARRRIMMAPGREDVLDTLFGR